MKEDTIDKIIKTLLLIALCATVFGFLKSIYELVEDRDRRIYDEARVECIKDSLYKEYVTDKLNKR